MSSSNPGETSSRTGASGDALTAASAFATCARTGFSSGKDHDAGSTGLPWRRFVLDSDGGSRISTERSLRKVRLAPCPTPAFA